MVVVKFMHTLLGRVGAGRRAVNLVRLADDRGRWRSMVANVT